MMRSFTSNRKGFTLIEVILSIAIIGIMAVSFIPVFTAGFKAIVFAGNEKTEMFNSQSSIEQEVANYDNSSSGSITIVFPVDGSNPELTVNMSGEVAFDGSYILFNTKKN